MISWYIINYLAISCLYIGFTLWTSISAEVVSRQSNEQNLYGSHQDLARTFLSQNLTISNRPIDRPNLLSNNLQFALNGTKQLSGPENWLLMGEGDDLLINEARSLASYSETSDSDYGHGRDNSSSVRRSHQKRKSSNKSQSRGSSANSTGRSQFDDEQSDSSEPNEIFDDVEDGSLLAGSLKEPECASHGRYYCTYKEEYPLKLVTEVTKYYKWPLEKLFRDLHAQIMPKLAQDSTGNLVCDSITRVVRPGWARNTNDRWLVVINTENYHQYVTEVVCQYGTNSRCNFIPPCYYSSCQQRYNTQKLLVIDPLNPYRGPFLSEFLFPSCCVCYVPTASDTFQDKYRSSPATIYQRTMQQESSNNMHPPQFRPAQIVEELGSGSILEPTSSRASSTTLNGASMPQKQGSNQQTAGPGEIRREGEQYKKGLAASIDRRDALVTGDFPRVGISESPMRKIGQARAS